MSKTSLGCIAAAIFAAVGAAESQAAWISASGSGYAPAGYGADATAEFRNVRSNASTFEIGLKKAGVSGYAATGHATWVQGVNTITITYDTAANQATFALNGVAQSIFVAEDPRSIGIHLQARNSGSLDASLALQSMTLNGDAVDLSGAAGYLAAAWSNGAGDPMGNTHIVLTDPMFATSSWTLSAQIAADWSGAAPNNSNTRVDLTFTQIPTPAAASIGMCALALVALRRGRR